MSQDTLPHCFCGNAQAYANQGPLAGIVVPTDLGSCCRRHRCGHRQRCLLLQVGTQDVDSIHILSALVSVKQVRAATIRSQSRLGEAQSHHKASDSTVIRHGGVSDAVIGPQMPMLQVK